jgi:WD40 repeat protein
MPPKVELSDYERKRQETIAKNQALLRNLALDAAQTGLAPSSRKKAAIASKPKKKAAPRVKEEIVPLRTSSRLKGIVADSEVAKRKTEDESVALQQAERAKRQRISGDLNVSDIFVSGKGWDQSGNFLTGVGPAKPYERTFTAQDIKGTTDKELRALRERMSGLALWQDVEPNRIKVTPERIYAMAFHPTPEKALIFAGDKLGNLGIFDSSQSSTIKAEDDEDEDTFEAAITTLKPHSRTISAFHFSHTDPNSLFMASYDSSIRRLDLAKGVAIEVYAPLDSSSDEPLSGVQMSSQDPNTLYFTTLDGTFGIHDMREGKNNTQAFQLSDKKIGGFSLNPAYPHFIVTASLDRFMRLWDLRKISGKGAEKMPALVGEHESRLSVSHAAFNEAGQVATSSYDDTVKIYDFSDCKNWTAGHELSEKEMKPKNIVQHNNQTGRWVTMYVSPCHYTSGGRAFRLTMSYSLRPQWHAQPSNGIQKFCIGNMNRFVDVYTSKGEQLAQLGGEGITAVPAVAQFHPTNDWVAAGTASGKLCFWQ